MTEPLWSARAKLARGNQHLETLKRQFFERFDQPQLQPAMRVEKHFYAATSHFLWSVSLLPEVPGEWGLLIGETLHAFRDALDHVAWQFVQAGSTPNPPKPEDVFFPIHLGVPDPERLKKVTDKRLPGVVNRRQLALVKLSQPTDRRPTLEQLRVLSNQDKHRAIHLSLLYPVNELQVEIALQEDCIVREAHIFDVFGKPLHLGTKLYRACVEVTGPNPEVKMKGMNRFTVGLDDGTYIVDALDKMAGRVGAIVGRAEDTF